MSEATQNLAEIIEALLDKILATDGAAMPIEPLQFKRALIRNVKASITAYDKWLDAQEMIYLSKPN